MARGGFGGRRAPKDKIPNRSTHRNRNHDPTVIRHKEEPGKITPSIRADPNVFNAKDKRGESLHDKKAVKHLCPVQGGENHPALSPRGRCLGVPGWKQQ